MNISSLVIAPPTPYEHLRSHSWLVRYPQKLFGVLYCFLAVLSISKPGGALRMQLFDGWGIPLWVIPLFFIAFGLGLLIVPRVNFQQMFFWSLPQVAYVLGVLWVDAPAITAFIYFTPIPAFFWIIELARRNELQQVRIRLLERELSAHVR